jgi:hypothetical protein
VVKAIQVTQVLQVQLATLVLQVLTEHQLVLLEQSQLMLMTEQPQHNIQPQWQVMVLSLKILDTYGSMADQELGQM